MQAVVTSGTAASIGFGPGVYAKTGTADIQGQEQPNSWLIAFDPAQDVAVGLPGGQRRLRRPVRRPGGKDVPGQLLNLRCAQHAVANRPRPAFLRGDGICGGLLVLSP